MIALVASSNAAVASSPKLLDRVRWQLRIASCLGYDAIQFLLLRVGWKSAIKEISVALNSGCRGREGLNLPSRPKVFYSDSRSGKESAAASDGLAANICLGI